MNLSEEEINSGVRKSRLSATFLKAQGEGGDRNWLNGASSKLKLWLSSAARDIGSYFKSVVGGAGVVISKVFSGDWGFFKTWFNEAPLLPKLAGTGAALLTGGVLLVSGGAAIGGIAGGVKAALGALVTPRGMILATAMPGIMTAVIGAVEWAWNFNWAVPDVALINQCKEAFNRVYEPLGDALGTSFAAIVVGRFGKAFSAPRTDVNIDSVAYYSLINPSLQETIIDAMADLINEVRSIAYEIGFLQTYKNVRSFVAQIVGKEDEEGWGGDSKPWVISQKVEAAYEELKASDYMGHISDEQWEGIESFGDSFKETFTELLTEEDTYVNWK